jgi:acetyl/propionyl-CoA carboxylase alpha subunit
MDTSLDGPALIFPEYDPMISKMIAWGEDRTEAMLHLLKGLREYAILGIQTNIIFLQEILQDDDYIQNRISTRYCDLRLKHLTKAINRRVTAIDHIFYVSAFLAGSLMAGNSRHQAKNSHSPWHTVGYWRQIARLKFTMGGEKESIKILFIDRQMLRFWYRENEYVVSGVRKEGGKLSFLLDGESGTVSYALMATGEEVVECQGFKVIFKRRDALPEQPAIMGSSDRQERNENMIVSPMYGKIVKINVKEKDTISKGDILLVIESMKIENNILAPRRAKVTRVLMNPGDQVELNKPIIAIE